MIFRKDKILNFIYLILFLQLTKLLVLNIQIVLLTINQKKLIYLITNGIE